VRRRLVLCVFLACLCVTAPANAIIGGAPDGSGHPFVVAIADPSGRGVIFTGTVISPTVVLTVAHGAARLEAARPAPIRRASHSIRS
jgi:hypothetical protein